MIWLNLFAHLFVLAGLGYVLLAGVGIFANWLRASAPTDSEEWGDGDAWDRGHDRWVDEQEGVA